MFLNIIDVVLNGSHEHVEVTEQTDVRLRMRTLRLLGEALEPPLPPADVVGLAACKGDEELLGEVAALRPDQGQGVLRYLLAACRAEACDQLEEGAESRRVLAS